MFVLLTCLAVARSFSFFSGAVPEEFSCQVVCSADPSLQDRWEHVDSAQFQVRSTERVYRGQHFAFHPFFLGYGTNGRQEADLAYSVRITRPDGKVYHESDGHIGWKRTVAEPGNVLLAEELVGCFFDPADPFGTYTARIQVTDGVAGSSAEATTEVQLVEYEEGAGFEDLKALETWMFGYSVSPEPQRIVPGLRTLCRNGGFRESDSFQVGDGFFLELMDSNAWLFPEVLDGLEKHSADEKRGALWLLAHASIDREAFVESLSKEDKGSWKEISAAARDPMAEPLRERHDVNELYGRYIASRRLAPLERLVLALHEDGGAISGESVHEKSLGVDVPLARVVPKVVAKLLGELFASDPVARGYAAALAGREELPEGVEAKLTELLPQRPR